MKFKKKANTGVHKEIGCLKSLIILLIVFLLFFLSTICVYIIHKNYLLKSYFKCQMFFKCHINSVCVEVISITSHTVKSCKRMCL